MSATTTPTPIGIVPVSSLTQSTAVTGTDQHVVLQVDSTATPPQMVPRLVPLSQLVEGITGTAEGTLAAGNDARLVNAAQVDADGNLALKGTSLTLAGAFSITTDAQGNVTLTATSLTVEISLGTNDPGRLNQWWNNAGLVAISAGPAA